MESDWATRQRVMDEHWEMTLGLLYFLQHHPTVPNYPEREIVDASLIRGRRSRDGGITWSDVETIAEDSDRKIFYVPNVFLSHKGTLWTFVLRMTGHDLPTQLEALALDEATNRWEPKGFITELFLPNCPPMRMSDGNFVMAGRIALATGAQFHGRRSSI